MTAFNQAEWAQGYDADEHLAVHRSSTPVLSQATFDATAGAISRYQSLVSAGGWPVVRAERVMRLGSEGDVVVTLRRRLAASGDLDPSAGDLPVFDSFVDAGVRRFQARHGLQQTGIVDKDTLSALNVPADVRLRQLQINLVRLKAFSGNLGERFVMANIPAAAVETVENGVVATHHVAGVGRFERQSPVMMTKATDIDFNPFWTVPASIIKKDLIPRMQSDPNYLAEHKIRIFDKAGNEVQASQINWNSDDATITCSVRTPAPTSMRSAWCGSIFRTRTASICMTRRSAAFSVTISATFRRAASACRMCAIMWPGC